MSDMGSRVRRCSLPFFEFHLHYHGLVRGCCYYYGDGESWDFSKPGSFRDVWNGENFQKQRAFARSAKAGEGPCGSCHFLQLDKAFPYGDPPEDATPDQRANWQSALDTIESGSNVAEYRPVRYVLYFGSACNISCTMCCDRHNRKTKDRLSMSALDEILEDMRYVYEVHLIGGEPLHIPEAQEFIKALASREELANVRLSVGTNGTLLHNYWDVFESLQRLRIGVSLDSVGEAYERIRKGAKWAQVEENLLTLKRMGEGRPWELLTNSVIMKSSLDRLDELVEWSVRHDIRCQFKALIPQPFATDEDVWRDRSLLNEIPGWEARLDRSVDMLSEHGWDDLAKDLLTLTESLR